MAFSDINPFIDYAGSIERGLDTGMKIAEFERNRRNTSQARQDEKKSLGFYSEELKKVGANGTPAQYEDVYRRMSIDPTLSPATREISARRVGGFGQSGTNPTVGKGASRQYSTEYNPDGTVKKVTLVDKDGDGIIDAGLPGAGQPVSTFKNSAQPTAPVPGQAASAQADKPSGLSLGFDAAVGGPVGLLRKGYQAVFGEDAPAPDTAPAQPDASAATVADTQPATAGVPVIGRDAARQGVNNVIQAGTDVVVNTRRALGIPDRGYLADERQAASDALIQPVGDGTLRPQDQLPPQSQQVLRPAGPPGAPIPELTVPPVARELPSDRKYNSPGGDPVVPAYGVPVQPAPVVSDRAGDYAPVDPVRGQAPAPVIREIPPEQQGVLRTVGQPGAQEVAAPIPATLSQDTNFARAGLVPPASSGGFISDILSSVFGPNPPASAQQGAANVTGQPVGQVDPATREFLNGLGAQRDPIVTPLPAEPQLQGTPLPPEYSATTSPLPIDPQIQELGLVDPNVTGYDPATGTNPDEYARLQAEFDAASQPPAPVVPDGNGVVPQAGAQGKFNPYVDRTGTDIFTGSDSRDTSTSAIKRMQTNLGLNGRDVDGKFGPDTIDAIRRNTTLSDAQIMLMQKNLNKERILAAGGYQFVGPTLVETIADYNRLNPNSTIVDATKFTPQIQDKLLDIKARKASPTYGFALDGNYTGVSPADLTPEVTSILDDLGPVWGFIPNEDGDSYLESNKAGITRPKMEAVIRRLLTSGDDNELKQLMLQKEGGKHGYDGANSPNIYNPQTGEYELQTYKGSALGGITSMTIGDILSRNGTYDTKYVPPRGTIYNPTGGQLPY